MFCACLGFRVSCSRGSGNEKRYDLKGKVVSGRTGKHLVTISHEEVKGYMPAMTMPVHGPNESDLQILAPNDRGYGDARRRWFAFVAGESDHHEAEAVLRGDAGCVPWRKKATKFRTTRSQPGQP